MNNEALTKYRDLLQELAVRKKVYPHEFFQPQDYQQELFNTDKRNIFVQAGNRAGKTISAGNYVIRFCLENEGARVVCVTNSANSVPVQQDTIQQFLPKSRKLVEYAVWDDKTGFRHKIIKFRNGSLIRFKVIEQGQVQAFAGYSSDLIWIDEPVENEGIYREITQRLVDRDGILLYTFTPVLGQHKYQYLYDRCVNPGVHDLVLQWDATQNKKINQSALQYNLGNMSKVDYQIRRFGQWQNTQDGLVYYAFSDENIINYDIIPTSLPDIDVACDFNASFMGWTIIVNWGDGYEANSYIFDEIICDRDANTFKMCEMVQKRYGDRNLTFYIDEAGTSRRSNATKTDKAIIKSYFPNSHIYHSHIHSVRDRTEAVNMRLQNARGERHLYVNEKCINTIKDFRNVDHSMIGENHGYQGKKGLGPLTHISDGISYWANKKYNLKKMLKPISKTVLF